MLGWRPHSLEAMAPSSQRLHPPLGTEMHREVTGKTREHLCPRIVDLVPSCASAAPIGNSSNFTCASCLEDPGNNSVLYATASAPRDRKLYVVLAVPPFLGNTALAGLLRTSPNVSTMCGSSELRNCEGTARLVRAGAVTNSSEGLQTTDWSLAFDWVRTPFLCRALCLRRHTSCSRTLSRAAA